MASTRPIRAPHTFTVVTSAVLALGLVTVGQAAPPAPPPDPAITYYRPGSAKLMKMNADGSNQTTIEANVRGHLPYPEWSEDATQVVHVDGLEPPGPAEYGVFAVGSDGSNHRLVTTSVVWGHPSWSPGPTADGTPRIAFVDYGPGSRGDLFLVRSDGSGRMNLTNTSGRDESEPTWNPSATRVAAKFGHNREPGPGWHDDVIVYDLALIGGQITVVGEVNLTDVPGSPLRDATSLAWPAWARTQDRIAVSARLPSDPSGRYHVWVIDLADPANPVNITATDAANHFHPTWSSDDSEIAFTRSTSRGQNVYKMSANGTNQRQLARDAAYPDWKR